MRTCFPSAARRVPHSIFHENVFVVRAAQTNSVQFHPLRTCFSPPSQQHQQQNVFCGRPTTTPAIKAPRRTRASLLLMVKVMLDKYFLSAVTAYTCASECGVVLFLIKATR